MDDVAIIGVGLHPFGRHADKSAFEAFLRGRFQTVAGPYQIDIGQSSTSLPIHLETHAPPGPSSQDNLGMSVGRRSTSAD